MNALLRLLSICLFTVTLLAQDKPQPDLTVFGLQIGKPFTLPECPTMQLGRNRFTYSGKASTPCYKRTEYPLQTKSASVYTASILIEFPPADSPKLSSGLDVSAQIMDGNLEGIGFNTMGVRDGERVLQSLSEKYGTPTSKRVMEIQGGYGTVYPRILATWTFSNLEVSFNSIAGQLDSGLVTIDSLKCRDWRQARLKQLTGSGRPL